MVWNERNDDTYVRHSRLGKRSKVGGGGDKPERRDDNGRRERMPAETEQLDGFAVQLLDRHMRELRPYMWHGEGRHGVKCAYDTLGLAESNLE